MDLKYLLNTDSSLSILESHGRLEGSNRLGQVSGSIDVNSSEISNVVRQQLKRNDVEDALEAIDCLGYLNTGILLLSESSVSLRADDDWVSLS